MPPNHATDVKGGLHTTVQWKEDVADAGVVLAVTTVVVVGCGRWVVRGVW